MGKQGKRKRPGGTPPLFGVSSDELHYVCKNDKLEISCLCSLSKPQMFHKSEENCEEPRTCWAPGRQPRTTLAISSFKSSSKGSRPAASGSPCPPTSTLALSSLPEQTASAEHPLALRKDRLPPSWLAQWLLLQPLGFPPSLWQPSLCSSPQHALMGKFTLWASVSLFVEWGFQQSALSSAVKVIRDGPCEGPGQSGPQEVLGSPLFPKGRAIFLHTWSSVKVNSLKAPRALYKHKQNLSEAVVNICAAQMVSALEDGLEGHQEGILPAQPPTVWKAETFSGVGRMGQGVLGEGTQPWKP